MMSPTLEAATFMDVSADGTEFNVYDAKFKNVRFTVSVGKIITVDAGTEANLPLIAEREIGDKYLWWVLLDYNGLLDPIQDITPGVKLKIPDRAGLLAFLQRDTTSYTSNIVII